MTQRLKPIFSFTLRINKNLAKLEVYDQDTLEDVMQRFKKIAKLKDRNSKIKDKLQDQFEKFL